MTEYETLYEAGKTATSVALIVFGIISAVLLGLMIIFRKKIKLLGMLGLVLVFVMFAYMSVQALRDYVFSINAFKSYSCGEYSFCEGEITQYNDTGVDVSGQDSFIVNEQRFQVGIMTGYGYKVTKLGGSRLDNGVKVRITYIENGVDNVIMKLEAEK